MNIPDSCATPAQKEAGNYRKQHEKFAGMDITIETPAGSLRSGQNAKGEAWTIMMRNDYGYIRGTEGRDKDHMDCFLGPNPKSEIVFVINQRDPYTKNFDEHKIMLGFDTAAEARAAYLSNYAEGWQGISNIIPMSLAKFKQWVFDGKKKTSAAELSAIYPRLIELMATWRDQRLRKDQTAAISPKLDGINVTVTKQGLFTKSGQEVQSQPLLKLRLKPFFWMHPKAVLKGELYKQGTPFENIIAGAKQGGRSQRLQLHLFPQQPQSSRPFPILGIRQIKEQTVRGQAALDKVHQAILKAGNEGSVIRTAAGEFKRKPFQDTEYTVVDATAGIKHGSFTLRDKTGKTFKAQGPAPVAAQSDLIGKPATVRYSSKSARGVPRSGVVKAIRDYDMTAGVRRVLELARKVEENPWDPAKDAASDALKDAATDVAKSAIKQRARNSWLARFLGLASLKAATVALETRPGVRRGVELAFNAPMRGAPSPDNESWWQRNKFRVLGSAAAVPVIFAGLRRYSPMRTGLTARPGTPGAAKLAEAVAQQKFEQAVIRRQKFYSRDAQAQRVAVDREARKRASSARDYNLSSPMRLVLFNEQSPAYGQRFGPSENPLAAYRKAKRILPSVKRAGEVSQDLADVAQGRAKKAGQKRFWEKSWFHNALIAGAIAAPIAVVRRQARQVADREGRAFVPLSANLTKVVNLDIAAEDKGWDVRDPRGRSARVFAPGSKRRERREKTWDERVDNIRATRNAALLAAAAGLGSTAYLLFKGKSRRALKPAEMPASVVPFRTAGGI